MFTFSCTDRIIPPSFTRKLKETNGVLGSSVSLECKVAGSPPITVAWFQNGQKITSGEKYQTTFSDNVCILQISSLNHDDTGTYTCKAANVAGSNETRSRLSVQGQYLVTDICNLLQIFHSFKKVYSFNDVILGEGNI